ncbi:hypothetical protein [Cutibacterium sp.]|uniref:hypothetical protein n=1 Tax=Cutibacterium sp. TaxID=1912221 RepID=UPI0026DB35B4|nr:hypothetical protein [Cutibacterium sp.]MDO4412849.1 hypothetical protein [Cutibacterium sp.]
MATRTTIHHVIEQFQQEPSTAQRGAHFEDLMVSYGNGDDADQLGRLHDIREQVTDETDEQGSLF